MARLRTLTQLIADVRQRADVENSQHVSDAEVTRYINQGIAALHALIVENNEDEYAAEIELSVSSGSTSTNILTGDAPGGPYKILGVDVVHTNGDSFPVRRFILGERAQQDSESRSIYYQTRYRLRGLNTIIWSPPFEQDVTVRVTYVESSVDLASGSDTYDGRDGWEEWVTLDAAIKVMVKEESDDAQLVRERAIVEARILKQIARRDLVEPNRIRDVQPFGGERW